MEYYEVEDQGFKWRFAWLQNMSVMEVHQVSSTFDFYCLLTFNI